LKKTVRLRSRLFRRDLLRKNWDALDFSRRRGGGITGKTGATSCGFLNKKKIELLRKVIKSSKRRAQSAYRLTLKRREDALEGLRILERRSRSQRGSEEPLSGGFSLSQRNNERVKETAK